MAGANPAQLMDRAVAVINVDICIVGDILSPSASPILKDVFLEAIKAAPSTLDPSKSYYDFLSTWLAKGEKTKDTSVEEYVKILGSGSDHASFAFFAGVPSIYFSFEIDEQKYPGVGSYPAYHTGFETFYLMEHVLDPGFLLHRSCTQLSTHMLLQVSRCRHYLIILVIMPASRVRLVAFVNWYKTLCGGGGEGS